MKRGLREDKAYYDIDKDINTCLTGLRESQDADKDQREYAREAHLFIDKKDGQWEPFWWNANAGKPRYTFDLTSPVIDQVAGELEQANFSIKVNPAGGESTKATAQVLDGLIRNIENISNATDIYNQSARNMITAGIDGWRVVQKFVDDNSFNQDLVIEPIHNFIDRCWLDVASESRDGSDAKHGWVLTGLTKAEYKKQFPDGSQQSVSTDADSSAYFYQPDLIMVGEYYYIKEVPREIVLMSDGAVYEVDEDFELIADELLAIGITEVNRRERLDNKVYVRKFDAGDWLSDEKETVFSYIPLIPTYANYKIYENKLIYHGVVEKLIDAQRVLNYSMSREIEEGALAPRAKYWMTHKQASGHTDTLSTLNTNNDPVQFYNPDSEAPPPVQSGGAMINPGLRTISESMQQVIGQSAGLFAANMGDNPGLQSGVAIERLQNKGDTGKIKFFTAQEVAIKHTAKIIIDAIPKIYDTDRVIQVLADDGELSAEAINHTVIDQQSGQTIVLNDLSIGTYDVVCTSGASFRNRQQEANAAFLEMAQVDPSLIQMGGDIVLKNTSAPGMDVLAERKRKQLFEAGAIPESQLTDEEKQLMQAKGQQEQQPDALMVAAQAEMQKAQAENDKNQLTAQKNQLDAQKAQMDAQNQAQQQQLDFRAQEIKIAELEMNSELKKEQFDFDSFMQQQELQIKQNAEMVETMKTQAETMQIMKETLCKDGEHDMKMIKGLNEDESHKMRMMEPVAIDVVKVN